MNNYKNLFFNVTKSKFIRSLFFRIVAIFLLVMLAITAIVFFSFANEINESIIAEHQKQLDTIENTMSKRLDEVASITYSIGNDRAFYLEALPDAEASGYEMSKMLERYLVGNDFIEHLAYYRLSEPNTLYVSSGELAFDGFFQTYLGLDSENTQNIIKSIQSIRKPSYIMFSFGGDNRSFLAHTCPLPQFSENPQAFVLVLIPLKEVRPILETQLTNCYGEIAMFNADGEKVYQTGNLDESAHVELTTFSTAKDFAGGKYIVQKQKSVSNGWTYISAIRTTDIAAEVTQKQLLFIIALLLLTVVAVFATLASIIVKYKPINLLAMTVTDDGDGVGGKDIIDEGTLLSSKLAALQDDSDQKQKFEEAYHAAEAANKAKSTFLSNMSHDIRTPMNSIVGMTEIAIKNADNPDYVKDCLQKVRVASQYLRGILNNVLDMSRIESGKFTLTEEVVDLPKLVHGMIAILNQNVEVKSQHFIVTVNHIRDEKIIGDSVRLAQVFINILSNSIKFTPNGGTLTMDIRQTEFAENGYGDYIFTFTDTGIGMSPEFTKKVFDTFTRDTGEAVAKIEGTGLGMSIAKSFIELMGGTIRCESELGKGTTFTITLHAKLAAESISMPDKKDVSVLIIGREPHICENQAALFDTFGIRTADVRTVAQAVAMVKQENAEKRAYDFIVINQESDDKNGLQAMAQLSAVKDTSDTTYVFIAKDMSVVDRSAAQDTGIAAALQFPLFGSMVRDMLDKNFKRHSHVDSSSVINLEGRRVLLVEDNQINRQIAHVLISETKAEVVDAVNGKEAVDAFKSHEAGYFDVILMDVQMPVMNGYEATAAIRSVPRADAATVPIYAMTANTFDEDVRQVKEVGMNGHLGKPYLPEELYKILREAIGE